MTTDPGQLEYEAWDSWLRGPRPPRPDELWSALGSCVRHYWAAIEREKFEREPPPQWFVSIGDAA